MPLMDADRTRYFADAGLEAWRLRRTTDSITAASVTRRETGSETPAGMDWEALIYAFTGGALVTNDFAAFCDIGYNRFISHGLN